MSTNANALYGNEAYYEYQDYNTSPNQGFTNPNQLALQGYQGNNMKKKVVVKKVSKSASPVSSNPPYKEASQFRVANHPYGEDYENILQTTVGPLLYEILLAAGDATSNSPLDDRKMPAQDKKSFPLYHRTRTLQQR